MILTTDSRLTLSNFERLPTKIVTALRRGAYISGKEMTNFLRGELTKKGRSGKTYRVYKGIGGRLLKNPKIHQASSENEYPATITGAFRKSVDFKVQGLQMTFGSGLGGLKYAKHLEDGTSKMKARKPVGRVIKQFENRVKTNLTKEVNKCVAQIL